MFFALLGVKSQEQRERECVLVVCLENPEESPGLRRGYLPQQQPQQKSVVLREGPCPVNVGFALLSARRRARAEETRDSRLAV